MATDSENAQYHDVIIIGAGVSGINAAYRIQSQCKRLSYTVLERRHDIGGTWAFFKYPGIRSDSPLYSFGFGWEPWFLSTPIADANSILKYMRDAAEKYGIDKNIRFGQDVTDLSWSSEEQCWTLKTTTAGRAEPVLMKARYVIASTGFYNYREALKSTIPGIDNFAGQVVHPQFWPEDLNYEGKRMAIVGCGATAITIFPVVAKTASKVTMVQRSPGFITSVATSNPADNRIRAWLPRRWAGFVLRWKYTFLEWAFFMFTQRYPQKARDHFLEQCQDMLPENIPMDPHFTPRYNPWDQRLCVCPDGDFYEALKSGRADVQTGVISTVDEKGIVMDSGERIDCDILVTATGLKLQMLGGARMTVDGKAIDVADQFMWRGTMIQDVPNAMVVIGFWNSSWTLGAELATQIFIKTIKNAVRSGMTSFTPTIPEAEEQTMKTRPLWNMTSTYLKTGNMTYPKASEAAPWTMKDNMLRDWWAWLTNDLFKGMVFENAHQIADKKQ